MREILFRGKRIDNGEWVEGFLVKHPSAVQIGDCSPWYISVPPKDPDDNGGSYNIIPDTVGQFTGLADENGKKIFEGDMVVSYDLFGRTDGCGIVTWNDLFVAWHMGEKSMYGRIASYEVIGNIHDSSDSV